MFLLFKFINIDSLIMIYINFTMNPLLYFLCLYAFLRVAFQLDFSRIFVIEIYNSNRYLEI